jgi:tRNA1(Val) A37 N6-methylase TrmN6
MLQSEYLYNGERIDTVDGKISLIQKTEGFAYGTDAVLLASYIRKMPKKTAVEFGAGTGIISLLCEEHSKFGKIFSVEIQEDYYDLLKRNAKLNASNIITINSDIRALGPQDFGGEVDVVFSNPPYMKADSGRSNLDAGKNTARHEVEGGVDDFCKAACRILKHGGLFYCVYRPDRAIDLLCSMRRNNLEPKRMTYVYPYVDGRPCLMLVEAKKGASAGLFNTKPFIIFNSKTPLNDDNTDDMNKVYKECDMDDEYKLL